MKCKNLEKQTKMAEWKNENNAGDLNGLVKKRCKNRKIGSKKDE